MADINHIRSADIGEEETTPTEQPFLLPATRSRIVRAAATGDSYRIDIALPVGDPPPQGWPAVFLLDAKGCFATCVEAMRRMSRRSDATGVGDAVIIGISSPGQEHDAARRRRDFASPRPGDGETANAPAFLAFIEQQVKPLLAGELPLDAARQTLFGHSLAGYFTLWVLAHHPVAFRGYAAISPSIWWDSEALLGALSAVPAGDRHVLICIGEWEGALPPWQAAAGSADALARRQQRRMIANAEDAAARLSAAIGDARVDFRLLPEEDHASIVSAAIPRMLRMASRA